MPLILLHIRVPIAYPIFHTIKHSKHNKSVKEEFKEKLFLKWRYFSKELQLYVYSISSMDIDAILTRRLVK